MTRDEARQIIATWLVSSKGAKGQRGYIEGWFDEEDVEAFRMAIEALQIVRCKDCKYADFKSPYPVCNLIEMNITDNDFCSWGDKGEVE